MIDDDVPWLSDEEQGIWRAFLRAHHILRERLDQQMQRDAGMPHAYYLILVVLSEQPDRTVSMTGLARATQYSPSRLSHAVRKMEAMGWVVRQRHPDNGRVVIARLTDAGFEVLRAAAPGHIREVRRLLFDPLTAEQLRRLGEISRAMTEAAGPSDDWGSDGAAGEGPRWGADPGAGAEGSAGAMVDGSAGAGADDAAGAANRDSLP